MKISTKLELERATIELMKDADTQRTKYTLWIHNRSVDEHVSITMNIEELTAIRDLLTGVR